MLTDNQKVALESGLKGDVKTLLASLAYNVKATIGMLDSVKTENGFNAQWQSANPTQKPALASLHGLYVGQYVDISTGVPQHYDFSFTGNRIPFNIHMLEQGQVEATIIEKIKEYGPQAINVIIEVLEERIQPQPQPQQGWPEYIGREVYEGVTDGLMGYVNLFLHPIDTAKNLGEVICHPIDTVVDISRHACEHPIRFGADMVVSFGIGALAGFGLGKLAADIPKPRSFTPAKNLAMVKKASIATSASIATVTLEHQQQAEEQRRREIDTLLESTLDKHKACFDIEAELTGALERLRLR